MLSHNAQPLVQVAPEIEALRARVRSTRGEVRAPVVSEPGRCVLTPKQEVARTMLSGPQRHTLFVGGARSTKTFTFVRAMVTRAISYPGSRHVALRFRNNAVWASIGKDTLPKVMQLCYPQVPFTGPHEQGYFRIAESEFWLGGLDEKERVEKILGQEFFTIFFNECSQIPYSSVVTALTRLAQVCGDGPQRAYYDLNPTNKRHWTNVLFIEKRDPVSGTPIPDPENYKYMFMHPVDNIANLSQDFLRSMERLPPRQRKRFLEGVYSDDDDGSLWSYELVAAGRRPRSVIPDMRSVAVAIDPSGASNETDEGHDAIGIMVAGLGVDGHGYVLEDLTTLAGPRAWGQRAIAAYHQYQADHIVAEANFGGAMVEYVIKSLDPQVPVKLVTASRGKVVRAEPVSALYGEIVVDEKASTQAIRNCRVHHVGDFPDLEDEMTGFTTLGYIGERSPNRVDALVWALTDLMLEGNAAAWIEHYAGLAQRANAPDELVESIGMPIRRGQRPAVQEPNELYELYQRTLKGIVDKELICARKACAKPIAPGDQKITDGINSWHVGCN
jgi:hypothetical protein